MLNLTHLKYAFEIYKTRSISRAAENLYMGQPNLSRAVKELEKQLGITIFERTPRGMIPTARGEEFLQYIKKVLNEIDEIENIFTPGKMQKQKFSVSVPRSSYISYAFAEFAKHIAPERKAEIFYKETNSMRAINNILKADYKLGIVRYQNVFDAQYKQMLDEKGLDYTLITEFSYVLAMSEKSPLSKKENITPNDLKNLIEIAHGDPYVPSLPITNVRKAELDEDIDKRIFVFERGSQFDLLEKLENTFMWVSPIPNDVLKKYGLVQRKCPFSTKIYKDVLIFKKDYRFSELDKIFIDEICNAKRKYIDV